MPFFSIIIPTYNRSDFVSFAIESVVSQTFQDWELIIVDDGSTDDTKDVVAGFLSDVRIRYIWQANQERSVARNNGISLSKGEYICFLDSDDYYLPNHLSTFYDRINETSASALFSESYIEIDGRKTEQKMLSPEETYSFDALATNTITPQAVCLKKSVLASNLFNPEIRMGEDRELWLRIAHDTAFVHIPEATFVLREHDGRSINSPAIWACREGLKTARLICKLHKRVLSKSIRNNILGREYYNSAKYFIFKQKKLKAIYYLLLVAIHQKKRAKEAVYISLKLLLKKA